MAKQHVKTRLARMRAQAPARPVLLSAALAVMTVLAGAVPAGAAAAAPAAPASTAPVVRQLSTVVARNYTTTYATLVAYTLKSGKWVRVYGPWSVRVGYNGIAPPGTKREGDGKTPSGTYGFRFFFGVQPNLRFAFPFRHAYSYDYWDDDPASARYNEWVVTTLNENPGRNPEPMHNVPAYNYAAVIAYNTARTPGLGSAIFLHVEAGGDTAGCVAVPETELVKLLHWLLPANNPRISISG